MKRQYSLYLDIESMEILKARNINISNLISSICEVEAGLIPEEKEGEVTKLKLANAKLIDELNSTRAKIVSLEKEKKEIKPKIIERIIK